MDHGAAIDRGRGTHDKHYGVMSLEVACVENAPVPSNCFLVYDKERGDGCVIVDPGFERPDRFEEYLKRLALTPTHVILTHEHFDHVWGCGYLSDKYSTPIICSAACGDLIKDAKKNLSLFYDRKGFAVSGEILPVEEMGFEFRWQGHGFRFFPAPGHSGGGICVRAGRYLFTGDILLKGLRTVTKLFCGTREGLRGTLDKISMLKGQGCLVCPGHGESFLLDEYDVSLAL